MRKLLELLKEIEDSGFYGSLEIKFQNGAVMIWEKREQGKP